MEQYALYLRKSRADLEAEARGDGETLAKHRAALRAMADKRGLFIAREYAEIVSGDTIAARPQMQQLLSDVKAGMYAGVIVNDVDRLGRGDSIDQEIIKVTFAASHTLIITPNRDINPGNPSDDDMLDFSLFLARFEYKKISQRMTAGRYRSAASGKFMASHTPYGYRREYNAGTVCIVPDPITAPVVRMIFDMYVYQHYGITRIANTLTDKGIKTASGKPFLPVSVSVILKNPAYIGTVVYGRTRQTSVIENGARRKCTVKSAEPTICENAHEPIIPRELFDAAQDILNSHERKPPVNTRKQLSNPFAGLIICAECGHKMIVNSHGYRGSKTKYIGCTTHGCPTLCTKFDIIEEAVISELEDFSADYAVPELPPVHDDAQDIQGQLSKLEKRLARTRELLELEIYSPQEYILQRDSIQHLIDAARAELEALTAARKLIPPPTTEIKKTIHAYKYAQTATQKNELLRTIVDHITYKKTVPAPYRGVETFTITIYPKLVEHV